MCINNSNNNNNAIINKNYGLCHCLILLSKIPTGTRQNFFEIYTKFGHAPSKTFASPVLDILFIDFNHTKIGSCHVLLRTIKSYVKQLKCVLKYLVTFGLGWI